MPSALGWWLSWRSPTVTRSSRSTASATSTCAPWRPGATAPSSDALAALADEVEADAVVYGAGFENRPDLVARLAEDRELLGTPAESLAPVRDPWAVAAAASAAGARAPETRSVHELPEAAGARRGGMAAQAAPEWRWARGPRVGRRAPGADGDPPAPDRRTVVLGGGHRRWPPGASCSASPNSFIAGRASGGWAT